MARKSFSFLSLVAGIVLFGFFVVVPKTFATTYDHAYLNAANNNLNDLIGVANGSNFGTTNIVWTGGLPYQPLMNGSMAMQVPFDIASSSPVFDFSIWAETTSSVTQFLVNAENGNGCGSGHRQIVLQLNAGGTGNANVQADYNCTNYFSVNSGLSNANNGSFHMYTVTGNGSEIDFYVDDVLKATSTPHSWNGGIPGIQAVVGEAINQSAGVIGSVMCPVFGSNYLAQSDVDALWGGGTAPSNCIANGSSATIPSISTSTPMEQLKSDDSTQINEGSSTNESTVVFNAPLQSASTSDSLELQVEVATSTFSSIVASSTGAAVVSGNTASTTIGGLPNGSYIWQARAFDATNGATSSWQSFVASSTADFVIAVPTSTGFEISDGSVVGLYHLEDTTDSSGNLHTLTNTGPASFTSALLHNGVDIDTSGEWLTYPSNLGWTSTADSFSVAFWIKANTEPSSGQEMTLFHLDSATAGDYNYLGYRNDSGSKRLYYGFSGGNNSYYTDLGTTQWHFIVYTRDGSGNRNLYLDGVSVASNTTGAIYNTGDNQFGLGSDTGIGTSNGQTNAIFDEAVVMNRIMTSAEVAALYNGGNGIEVCVTHGCNRTIVSIVSPTLQQYMSDATTTINEGSTTLQSTVVFGAKLNTTGTSTEQLQVEVKPVGVSFINVANVTSSSYVASGTFATVTDANLANGSYHWQARVVDQNNNSSTWQTFGPNSTSTDFVVGVPMSAHFDGVSTLLYPGTNVGFGATDPFTMEFWYRTTMPTSSILDFIDMGDASSGFSIRRELDNGIEFYMLCNTGHIDFFAAPDLAAQNGGVDNPAGIWHSVVITKGSGTTVSAFNLYFDGAEQTTFDNYSTSISGNCFTSTGTDPIWFGGTTSTDPFTGEMDEVRIWKVEKMGSDISSSWDVEATSTNSDMLGLWQFNGTSSDAVTGNAASSIGAPSYATSSPFGHFLLDQNATTTKTAAQDNQMLWYANGSAYSSETDAAGSAWNTLGGAVITSTTSLASADIILYDTYLSDESWGAEWFNTTSSVSALEFNTYKTPYISTGYIQNLAMHELGHALGLAHSYAGNIMNWLVPSTGIYPAIQDTKDYNYLKGQAIWGN